MHIAENSIQTYAKYKSVRRNVWAKPWILQQPVQGSYTSFSDVLGSDELG